MDRSLRVMIEFWARPENRAEEPITGALCAAMLQAFAEIAGLREANQHLRNELAAVRKELRPSAEYLESRWRENAEWNARSLAEWEARQS